MSEIKTGMLIMNQSGGLAVVGSRVHRDPRWKCGGWRISPLRTDAGSDGFGMTTFLADYLSSSWAEAPTGEHWAPVVGTNLEQQWTYDPASNTFTKVYRKVER